MHCNKHQVYSITSSGAGEYVRRHGEAKRFGRSEIDDQLKFRRLPDWQIGGTAPLRIFANSMMPI